MIKLVKVLSLWHAYVADQAAQLTSNSLPTLKMWTSHSSSDSNRSPYSARRFGRLLSHRRLSLVSIVPENLYPPIRLCPGDIPKPWTSETRVVWCSLSYLVHPQTDEQSSRCPQFLLGSQRWADLVWLLSTVLKTNKQTKKASLCYLPCFPEDQSSFQPFVVLPGTVLLTNL